MLISSKGKPIKGEQLINITHYIVVNDIYATVNQYLIVRTKSTIKYLR